MATCDIDKSKATIGTIPFWEDFKSMVEIPYFEENIDAVAICTPNYLHAEMVEKCIEKGKKVLCEKPFSIDTNFATCYQHQVGVVLQLRHHPEIIKLREKGIKGNGKIIVKVFRDESYWSGWKGDEKKSGGILLNIGVHYLDLLQYLAGFNGAMTIHKSYYSSKLAKGKIEINGHKFEYHFEIMDTNKGQDRIFEINGKEISLSKKDNLSFEGLHSEVYKNFVRGKVVSPEEAYKSINIVNQLKCFAKNA